MGNVAAGALEQGRAEARTPVEVGDMGDPTPTLQKKKKTAPVKLPMPPEEELDERFNKVLVSYGGVLKTFTS